MAVSFPIHLCLNIFAPLPRLLKASLTTLETVFLLLCRPSTLCHDKALYLRFKFMFMRTLLVSSCLTLVLAGCGNNNSTSTTEKEPTPTTTVQNTPAADTPASKPTSAPEKSVAAWKGVEEITDASFTKKVLSNPGLTVVDFNATWCGPCKVLKPIFKEASSSFSGKASFASIDTDANPTVTTLYNVQSIPLLLFFKEGKIVNKIIGLVSAAELNKAIEQAL
jgi:thioredoxin 1